MWHFKRNINETSKTDVFLYSFLVYDRRNFRQVQSRPYYRYITEEEQSQPIYLVLVKSRDNKYYKRTKKPTSFINSKPQESIDTPRTDLSGPIPQHEGASYKKDWSNTRIRARPNQAEHEDNKKEVINMRQTLQPWSSLDWPSNVDSAFTGIQNDQPNDQVEDEQVEDDQYEEDEDEDDQGDDAGYDDYDYEFFTLNKWELLKSRGRITFINWSVDSVYFFINKT